jgi:hypothetical protein
LFNLIDRNGNAHGSNMTTSNLKHSQHEVHSIHEKNPNDETQSHRPSVSNSIKWYVSELRINRPLIYRTQWTNGCNRKLSHSVNDLNQVHRVKNCQDDCRYRPTSGRIRDIAYSTLLLHNFKNQQQCHQSNHNISLSNHLSCTDDDLNNLHSDEDDPHVLRKLNLFKYLSNKFFFIFSYSKNSRSIN